MNYEEESQAISEMENQLQEALRHGHQAIPAFAKQLRSYCRMMEAELTKLIEKAE